MWAVGLPLVPAELLREPRAEQRPVPIDVVALLHEDEIRTRLADDRECLLRAIDHIVRAVQDVPDQHPQRVVGGHGDRCVAGSSRRDGTATGDQGDAEQSE